MDLESNNYKDILMVLQDEVIPLKKIQYLEHLVSNFLMVVPLESVDAEILSLLMPQAKEVVDKVFAQVVELVYEDNEEEVCAQTLSAIQEHLQMIISLYEVIDDVLNFVVDKSKINFKNVESLPLHLAQILYVTFLHCKESNNIYKIYFGSLNEILAIFKKAQAMHSKFLNVIENCVIFNALCEKEIISLNNVLENLAEIGDVLSGMNVKSMADNWKCYLNLTQKYINELDEHLSIQKPLLFFTSELVSSLKNVLDMDMYDVKNITHTLKIANFILRGLVKLCDTFWKKVAIHTNILWNFFIDFFSIYSPANKNKQFSDNTINLLKSLIWNGLDQFLNKLSHLEQFYNTQLLESLITNTNSSLGFILVSNKVLQSLAHDYNKTEIRGINFSQYLNVIFIAISKCYILFMKEDQLYEELLVSIVTLVSGADSDQFSDIEFILSKNLLATFIWNSMFAYDAWILICRNCNAMYTFHTLCSLIEQSSTILKSHYSPTPQLVILSNFIAELYRILNDNHKLQFLKKYPFNTSLHVWKHIGLKNLPTSCFGDVEKLLINMVERMEKFVVGRCNYYEFLIMMDMMNIVASVPFDELYANLSKVNLLVIKLWDFDVSNKNLVSSNVFKFYLENLCKLTAKITWRLNYTQLIQVLHQLKQVYYNNDKSSRPLSLLILTSVINRSSDAIQESQAICQPFEELLTLLLADESPVIQIGALELIQTITNSNTWNCLVRNLSNKNPKVQKLISNFSNEANNTNTFKTYMLLENTEFQHECSENLLAGPVLKKQRVDTSPEILPTKTKVENIETTRLIQKIKKDVQYLGNLSGKDDMTGQNVKDINFILKELQAYV